VTALDSAVVEQQELQIDTVLDFVIPVYNEERALEASVRRLDGYLRSRLPYSYTITIADNASTDDTWAIAVRLEAELPGVRALHLDRKGRGRALRAAWSSSTAAVVGYMDVDLSTDLKAIPPLVAPLLSGHSDIAIGTRLARGSRVTRGPKREMISRCYNLLLHGVLAATFSDAQCGFKALRRDVAARLVPLVEDDAWFFDTEMLVLAEEAGLRIHEVPVDWVDDPDSRVAIAATARDDLRGVARLVRTLVLGSVPLERVARRSAGVDRSMPVQIVRFATVGVISTLAYLLLYLLLRVSIPATVANMVALLVTAVGNTAVNRRFTFGIASRRGLVRHHVVGLLAFGLGLLLTTGALACLRTASAHPSRLAELAVLVMANAMATLARFVVLRWATRR
jgi:glycosyltransferase involved in cell wall biosynthesis